jgi:hypothetical protein
MRALILLLPVAETWCPIRAYKRHDYGSASQGGKTKNNTRPSTITCNDGNDDTDNEEQDKTEKCVH